MSKFGYLQVKRVIDVIFAFTALFISTPIFIMIAIARKLDTPGPVFFRQQRPGLHGKPFTLYKFRTMTDERDTDGNLLPDAERLTNFGRFLRQTSLDELPELFNVLKGDMSLVGPRPLRMKYLNRYTSFQARRHNVRPGITGWAQINGRNAITWEKKFELDVWYVENVSMWLDLRILATTLFKVIRREGISAEGYTTVPEFMGTFSATREDEK